MLYKISVSDDGTAYRQFDLEKQRYELSRRANLAFGISNIKALIVKALVGENVQIAGMYLEGIYTGMGEGTLSVTLSLHRKLRLGDIMMSTIPDSGESWNRSGLANCKEVVEAGITGVVTAPWCVLIGKFDQESNADGVMFCFALEAVFSVQEMVSLNNTLRKQQDQPAPWPWRDQGGWRYSKNPNRNIDPDRSYDSATVKDSDISEGTRVVGVTGRNLWAGEVYEPAK